MKGGLKAEKGGPRRALTLGPIIRRGRACSAPKTLIEVTSIAARRLERLKMIPSLDGEGVCGGERELKAYYPLTRRSLPPPVRSWRSDAHGYR